LDKILKTLAKEPKIKTRQEIEHLPSQQRRMEDLETLKILLPSDKFTPQWINIYIFVQFLNIHNNIFDEPRKISPKIYTRKTPRNVFY
jgi:hypothetical protein